MFGARDLTITPALPGDFITLAEAKTFLEIADAASDGFLTPMITTASQAIEKWCGSLFFAREVTEKMYPEDANNFLLLSHFPVTAMTAVSYDGVAQTLADFQCMAGSGTVRRKDGATFPHGGEVAVTYTVGASPVIETMKQACRIYVREMLSAKNRVAGVTSESVSDVGSTTYGDTMVKSSSGVAIPAPVAELLGAYKRTFVV